MCLCIIFCYILQPSNLILKGLNVLHTRLKSIVPTAPPLKITNLLGTMVQAVVKITVVIVMIMKTNLTPIPTAFLYLQNFGIPCQPLPNLLFLNTTANTMSIQPGKIAQAIFLRSSGINCPPPPFKKC